MVFLQKLWSASHSANTDCLIFKLYYRCTVLMLLLFSFVITCRLVLGSSFFCSSRDFDGQTIFDNYCYTHGTHIDLAAMSDSPDKALYPGIALEVRPEGRFRYVPYYPWVNLFFIVLAILFFLPHLMWKICEGGLLTNLTSKVNDKSVTETERKAAIAEIAKYMLATRGGHFLYTGTYVLSEIFNWLIGVLSTVCLVNFFNVEMSLSTPDFSMETWDDFFAYNFPLMGTCTYKRLGPSGNVQLHNNLCHLPLNNLYGYMFLFLYAWFILLCVLQALVIPYRVFSVILPPIRLLLFRLRSGVTDHTLLDFTNTAFSLGDWFLLTRLQKNLLAHDLTKLLSYMQQNINKTPLEMEMNDLAKLE